MKTGYTLNPQVSFRSLTGLVMIASINLACSKATAPIVEHKPLPPWYEIGKPPSVSPDEERNLCWIKRSGPKPTKEEALQLLLRTSVFASDHIGYGMDMSAQVQAFVIILAESDAAPAFRHLLAKGNMAGRLYALIGLRIVDPTLFDREITAYLHDESRVRSFSGCLLSAAPVQSIANQIYQLDLGWRFTSRAQP